ncbi:MAG: Phosphate regulon transcriptional regulatory protein PhoB (SphR) [Ktedonobacterales bacterium]|nr:MAG: Phosphate regulon transcriptional regulatory protein PhoB (SphR) [Ktedonobacterales bacterium]
MANMNAMAGISSTTALHGADQPKRRVLVVDDEANIREVLGQYLELEGFTVMLAADGIEALRLAQSAPPDLVILDLMLPGIDGLEVCRRLRATSAAPVLMLTARSDESDKIEGFRAGTDDYVTKPFSPREVMLRVQAIMRRVEATSVPAMVLDGALRVGALVIYPQLHRAERDGVVLDLTAKEFDLLSFLAANPRQVFSRQQLLDRVWDYDYYGDASTVTVHIRRLREKVEADPARPHHIKTVWGVGYKFEP